MALKKAPPSPAEGEFLFEIDETPLEETLKSFGGLPLFLRTARSLGVGASVKRHLRIKKRRGGPDEAAYVESFLALNAGGGECLDDFQVLREDLGMTAMLGYEPPSPEPVVSKNSTGPEPALFQRVAPGVLGDGMRLFGTLGW